MSDSTDSDQPTVEASICSKWNEARGAMEGRLLDGENYVREEPLKAMAYAAAAGYVLRILPITAILRSVIRVLLLALKPAVVVYGAAKAYEIIVSSKKNN